MEECIFCKIIKGKIPTNFVYQDDEVVAFRDISPRAPVHILIIPRKHIASLKEVEVTDENLLGHVLMVAKKITQQEKIDHTGYQIRINTGKGAGQVIFHLHIHLLGGWEGGVYE